MRIACLSDVHGNLFGLEAVLSDVRSQAPDVLLVLGDLTVLGPQPAEAVAAVRALGARVVGGNTDRAVPAPAPAEELHDHRGWLPFVRNLRWTQERLSAADVAYLAGLPDQIELDTPAGRLLAFHATPQNRDDIILPWAPDDACARMFEGPSGPAAIAVYGHIHRPFVRTVGGKHLVNAGSAGFLLDGAPGVSWALLDVTADALHVTIRRPAYDPEPAVTLAYGREKPFADHWEWQLRHGRQGEPGGGRSG